ncbi:hypothetical protein BRADI_5g03159v3 [Brachypodium distachyon]|uniref:Reverse transcriptase zinc-binding domain-containing protein n=1 Tax=Brachypodium distachyon TaxID=15368 RepID=A0A2K2CF67_BRADI|nr:hypothetical protein BRADI_5g03159v3 [Brachypodium distachyon]
MDVLNSLFRKAEAVGLLGRLASHGLAQRASFFADDALCRAAISACVGNGRQVCFWTDQWLLGDSFDNLTPCLWKKLSPRAKRVSVAEALADDFWIRSIGTDLSLPEIEEFLSLWSSIHMVVLDVSDDLFRWGWCNSGSFAASSAYAAFFRSRELLPCAEEIWELRAPNKCKFFMWLAVRDRCWTTDRLSRRGLPHPASCPLCDQEPESISHLLLGCVAARQVWALILHRWGLPLWLPGIEENLQSWCSARISPERSRKDVNIGITLVCWCTWRHRNAVVFEGARPDFRTVLRLLDLEGVAWTRAGLLKDVRFSFASSVGALWSVRE